MYFRGASACSRPATSGGVWIGGVWNDHFPESEKYFSEAEICSQTLEIPLKERFLPDFKLRNLRKLRARKNAIPYPQPFHTPTRLPPIFPGSLTEYLRLETSFQNFETSSEKFEPLWQPGFYNDTIVVTLLAPQNPPNPKTIKVTKKWLKSDFWGSRQSNRESDSKVTFRSFLSHFWVTLVTFESLSGLLWDDPQKSLLSHFFVTLIVLGFGGFCGARRVTILLWSDEPATSPWTPKN